MKRFITILTLGAALGGCGFHLRGSQTTENLPDVAIRLDCPAAQSQDFCTVLSQRLQATGIRIDDSASPYSVTLAAPAETVRAVSISQSADAAENEITRSVSWAVLDSADGRRLEGRLARRESYRYDKSSGLGNDSEQARIRRSLDKQLAESLVPRIVSALRQLTTANHAD